MAHIPLFPLNTVLFPKQALPLHIFEERYKLMIGRCIDEKEPFGVVLLKSGEEASGDGEPYDVGTTARVARVQRLPDGRMNLINLGRRRFRILELDHSEEYLAGEVEYLENTGAAGEEVEAAAERIAALFAEQFRLVMAISSQWTREVNIPGAPAALADFVASQFDVPNEVKQDLLEMLSVPARLAREEELLGDLISMLTERWEESRQKRFAGAALN
ncbi:MAG: LON peptidase substrate-binding domain-containing protein [Chloroflexi bacterium]|nr:LON peptidase substrate-binding domain-containing protein [Chloroflexota bacterium]